MAFQDKVLLVTFRSSQWGRNKFDRTLSTEIEQNHGMAANASRVNKVLSQHKSVVRFSQHVSKCRTEFYKLALPWTEATRIIRSSRYSDFNARAKAWVKEADEIYQDIYYAWPDIFAQAQRDLSDAFNHAEYPLRESLRDRYRLQITYQRMGAVNNWVMELTEQEQRELQSQAVEAYKDSVRAATEDMWKRLHDRVQLMANTLNSDKQLRQPIISGLRDVLRLIPELAVTEMTPELKEQLRQAERDLVSIDLDSLRTDPDERKRKAQLAKQRLDEIKQNMQMV